MTTLNLYHVDQITDEITIPANCLVINHIEKTAVYFVDSFTGTYEQGKSVGIGYVLTDHVLEGNIVLLASPVPTEGLIAHYKMELNGTDEIGNFNGTLVGSTFDIGRNGTGYSFGSGTYAKVPYQLWNELRRIYFI